ncbi:phage portal protein [Bremerella sp. JC770]|uniref:phage portal protein n=1 Tax=Bremerella sp. JC770 TaxID=3232137 RepID=UPI00345A1F5E
MVQANKSLSPILGADGNQIRREPSAAVIARQRGRIQELRAKYDAAVTNFDNMKHWANADNLSASAAANPVVRRRLRSRARYECRENNSFAKGMIDTLANDVVGRGPNLQIHSPNQTAAKQLERNFRRWMKRTGLAATLRTAVTSEVSDGEIFAVSANNPNVRNAVQLDVRLLEADYCSDFGGYQTATFDDGIEYDSAGYPIAYNFLEDHPGDNFAGASLLKTQRIRADQVIHYYRQDRPGQRRGISWVAPALPLFALLRRYTLAVTMAAETVANFAGVMYADGNQVIPDDEVDPMDSIEFEMRSMLTLPIGWKLGQLKAEQPTTTYQMFRDALLCEISRCLNMPFNKASGNSSGYNFASGRLDHQTYFEFVDIERSNLETQFLDRVFLWWINEAVFIPGEIPAGIGPIDQLEYTWRWPKHQHIDPQKQSAADISLWNAGLLTDEEYQLENGRDPEEHYASLGRQYKRRATIGAPLPGFQQGAGSQPGNETTKEEAATDDDE